MKNASKRLISEADLLLPTLKLLNGEKDGFLSTSDLIVQLEKEMHPIGHDLEILEGRKDSHFSQKVRNMVSHKESPNNIINLGFAEYDEERKGLVITDAGRAKIQE
ncbi:hypothetical protein SAMN04488056_112162 [Cohaesibacter marisflavi]|uniref:Uncharacterized protein n=1 Tax=Cohaesibacter marisflavi TaxID=655353 RepID=A0A1I5JYE6_9HYPH|nr:hypothetical protein [Cohaesibacter marisflavi]SFO77769.1 hypothetical protein SAMN04488056_112162 [Cohaesibacter marisflavi]